MMWSVLTATLPPGARLLDLGCGTGIDAAHLGAHGYSVLATDWSEAMVARTRSRIAGEGLERQVTTRALGIHELGALRGELFDGIYSDLGPLNCVPDLRQAASDCAALLRPGGRMVASVIGRVCPWEVIYYALRGDWKRALLRWSAGPVPVPLNDETVWTRYFTPRQFFAAFAGHFDLTWYRGLRLLAPPPYMLGPYRRFAPACALAARFDEYLDALPILRDAGDHFLLIMTKRG